MLYMTKSKQHKFDNKGDTIVEDSTYFCGTTQRNEAKPKLESSMRVFRKCWFTDKAVVSVL